MTKPLTAPLPLTVWLLPKLKPANLRFKSSVAPLEMMKAAELGMEPPVPTSKVPFLMMVALV
jgi:hypothetical protein